MIIIRRHKNGKNYLAGYGFIVQKDFLSMAVHDIPFKVLDSNQKDITKRVLSGVLYDRISLSNKEMMKIIRENNKEEVSNFEVVVQPVLVKRSSK